MKPRTDRDRETVEKAVRDGSEPRMDGEDSDGRAREAMERYQAYITGYQVWIRGFKAPEA